MRTGSTAVIPRTKQTAELAAEPRPWIRIFLLARDLDDVPDQQEVAGQPQPADDAQLAGQLPARALGRQGSAASG